MEDWSGCCWLRGRVPANKRTQHMEVEAGNVVAAREGGAQKPNDTETQKPVAELEPLDWQNIDWQRSVALAIGGCIPLIVATGIVVVPCGMGGVHVSQLSGTLPGTLYPGAHFVMPLVDSVEMFDLRDHLFTAGVLDEGMPGCGPKPRASSQRNSRPMELWWKR